MTKKRDRFFALFGAILFLITASAFTILVIWSMVNSNNDSSSKATKTSTSANKLQGTKLASFTPVTSVPELQIIDQKVGDGQEVKANDTVTADYTGAVAATGVIFQSSFDTGSAPTFSLNPSSQNTVITGWQKGLVGMKVNGVRRLVIPANEAYGPSPPPSSGIPANAPLVFDITLRAIGS